MPPQPCPHPTTFTLLLAGTDAYFYIGRPTPTRTFCGWFLILFLDIWTYPAALRPLFALPFHPTPVTPHTAAPPHAPHLTRSLRPLHIPASYPPLPAHYARVCRAPYGLHTPAALPWFTHLPATRILFPHYHLYFTGCHGTGSSTHAPTTCLPGVVAAWLLRTTRWLPTCCRDATPPA